MASTSETGHYKNIANFHQLYTVCLTLGTAYNPSNPLLGTTSLNTLHGNALGLYNTSITAKGPYTLAVNARQTEFLAMRQIATRVFHAFKATPSIDPLLVTDLKSILDRIRGERTSKALPQTENAISVSQQSYDMLYSHFSKLIALVMQVPTYSPNEIELQPTQLVTLQNQLLTRNQNTIQAALQFKAASIGRNDAIYAEPNGLVPVAKAVKSYIASAFGTSSEAYKLVKGITFRGA
jgi:hypothetical protein